MVRIDLLLFGYRRITVSETDVRIVAGLFLERGLSVKIVNNCFLIREDKYKKIEDLMKGRVEFSASRELGFGGFLRNNCRRVGVILAVITSLLINIILGGVVWDVRVEGVTESEEREIINELSDCGLRVGAVWSKIDMNALEVKMLSMSNTVSWINVNRRGSVAYVSVIGKIQGSEEENVFGYANIVAKCDGIIEDITVVKGVALVTRGQTVKKGDILISGVTPLGYCYAEGNVTARLTDCVSVEIKKRSVEISEKCRKRYSVALKIFNFGTNIYKYSGNLAKEYDIIKLGEDFLTVNGKRLPVSITLCDYKEYQRAEVILTPDKMTALAAQKMQESLADRLTGSTLLRIRTEGEFTEDAYYMTSYITLLEEIGEPLSFTANDK